MSIFLLKINKDIDIYCRNIVFIIGDSIIPFLLENAPFRQNIFVDKI